MERGRREGYGLHRNTRKLWVHDLDYAILQVYTCQKMYQTGYFKYLVYCIAIALQ